ncbi:PREDICTED: LOW QUALITY PROTEIN: smoothelin-like protein 1 [Gavialis gangeticus]|uniref:LOW QUALITY PROTEIN: smoothelin-like protein 1 n=1 Tax=Gavialis gangeticus TaxID=94835 RepID=UPI00092E37C5|nr:PREDICTED: LOW QUALITY PROTEIN: smoothelin-like protein 1 [Gavialis gangeticus]
MRGNLQMSTGLWAGWTVFFAQLKSDPPTSGLLAEMEPQEPAPLPTPATEQPRPSEADGTAGESAEGTAGMQAKEAALGDKGLGGAGDHGSEAKGGSGAVVEDAGSEAKEDSGAVVEDAGSEAKGGSGAVVEDAGSEAKEGSGAVVEDAGSEAKGGSGAVVEDAGSEAKGGSGAVVEDAGSEAKEGSGVGGPEAEERAEADVGSKAVETAGVGVSGAEPQEEAAGTKPEKEVVEERGAGAPGKEERTASTSEEPLSPDPGEEEEYWPEFAPSSPDQGPASPTGSTVFAQDTGGSQSEGASKGQEGSASPGEAMQQPRERSPTPEGAAPPKEKPKRPALDRRELTRPRLGPRAQSRKAIVEKFGGAASGPAPNIKRTGGTNAIKNMLLEWCRAKTRGYEVRGWGGARGNQGTEAGNGAHISRSMTTIMPASMAQPDDPLPHSHCPDLAQVVCWRYADAGGKCLKPNRLGHKALAPHSPWPAALLPPLPSGYGWVPGQNSVCHEPWVPAREQTTSCPGQA